MKFNSKKLLRFGPACTWPMQDKFNLPKNTGHFNIGYFMKVFINIPFTQGGNLLISFLSESLVFCEQKGKRAIRSCTPDALLSWVTGAKHSWSLFCKEQRKRFSHGCCFLKSKKSKLLTPLFQKEQLSKERREPFTLGHKKGGKQSNTVKNVHTICFFSWGIHWCRPCLKKLIAICSQSLFCK